MYEQPKRNGRILPNGDPFDLKTWRIVRKRAIASKDPVCAICGQYIDVSLPKTDPTTGKMNPLAVEADHIVPISRGGAPYSIENVQLSHMRCTRKKSNKMRDDYNELEKSENLTPLSNNW